ncbi:hypothetical protein [Dokdonella immobilis]|uniref:Delta-60 repeat domain-containing protein n=1 Tax=Dokdonella immobilis TaxID=578942 RepID=A0A1I4ZNU3_9GAMM|nr:hypothetical protein [Dokdonella immobilis]SFN51882.1 delta-60 repeat domain-containing protein [Dokdonella immobilis]
MNVLKTLARACCAIIALASMSLLAADGDLDPAFGSAGVAYISPDGVTGHQLRARSVVSRGDGRIVLGGSRNYLRPGSPDPQRRPLLARLNVDGSPDPSFGDDVDHPGIVVFDSFFVGTQEQEIEGVLVLADGSVIATGTATAFGPTRGFVIKVDASGQLDGDFGNRGVVEVPNSYLHAIATDSLGRVVVAGERVGGDPLYRGLVMRLLSDGNFDDTFGFRGEVTLFEEGVDQLGYLRALAIDAGNRIVVGGQYQVPQAGFIDNYDLSIARLGTDGQLDPSFAGGGWRRFNVAADSDFDGIDRLLIQADGSIVFAGFYHQFEQGGNDFGTNVVIGRLDQDGATDASFGTDAGYTRMSLLPLAFNRYPTALIDDGQGRFMLAVEYAISGKSNFVALRTSGDGVPDPAFGVGGVLELDLAPQGIYSQSLAMTVQQDQPLLAGAAHRSTASTLVDIAVTRLFNDTLFADGFE